MKFVKVDGIPGIEATFGDLTVAAGTTVTNDVKSFIKLKMKNNMAVYLNGYEACGDDAVIEIDGQIELETLIKGLQFIRDALEVTEKFTRGDSDD